MYFPDQDNKPPQPEIKEKPKNKVILIASILLGLLGFIVILAFPKKEENSENGELIHLNNKIINLENELNSQKILKLNKKEKEKLDATKPRRDSKRNNSEIKPAPRKTKKEEGETTKISDKPAIITSNPIEQPDDESELPEQ